VQVLNFKDAKLNVSGWNCTHSWILGTLRIIIMAKSKLAKDESGQYSFFENVYEVVMLIPKGRVTSYGAIASYLGTKMSARMVGWAMNAAHSNKRIPAHRVVNRAGLLTGKHHFETPTTMKSRLEKEGIKVVKDQVQDFENIFWNPAKELL
jgi:methylated-DNA-protein-cysteine methyltransferase related protein